MELKSIFAFWAEQGVRIFRVDNPHTKPFAFWEWVIGELKQDYPEVIFLAEAFTRPKVMYRLAKLGFSQSYTYFSWRNEKWELEQYFTELTRTSVSEFFRPNLWPTTPGRRLLHPGCNVVGARKEKHPDRPYNDEHGQRDGRHRRVARAQHPLERIA